MVLNFEVILPSLPYILKGVGVTLQYVVLSLVFGIIGGSFLAVAKIANQRYLRFLANAYTSIFRGTPLLVQLGLVYYALPQLINWHPSPYVAGVLAFSLNSIAYVSEIMRGALESIDKGQWESAHVLGIPRLLVIKDIIIPQAIPRALPGLVNEMIDLLKESALVSTIGVGDLLRRAQVVAGEHFLYFEPYLIAAAIYYILVMILSMMVRITEKKFIHKHA